MKTAHRSHLIATIATLLMTGFAGAQEEKIVTLPAVPAAAPASPVILLSRENVVMTFHPALGPQVIRSTPVSLPTAKLDALAGAADLGGVPGAGGAVFSLQIRPDLNIIARVDRIERRGPDSYSIFASVPGEPESSIIIAVESGVASGWIFVPRAGVHARLRYAGPEAYLLAEINNSLMPDCDLHLRPARGVGPAVGNAVPHAPAQPDVLGLLAEAGVRPELIEALRPSFPGAVDEGSPFADRSANGGHAPPTRRGVMPVPPNEVMALAGDGGIAGSCAAPQQVFDILVLYTTLCRVAAGGTSAIQAEIQEAIDVSNQAYVNSQINARMRLVHRQEVTYDEMGTVENHRDRLAITNDGVLDFVHALRTDFGADICCLWVADDDGDTMCGIAYCTPPNASSGFCIVVWDCAVDNFSFVHEIGHLQGSAHDPPNAGACFAYFYSFGHNFNIVGTGWRHTVMSYSPAEGSQRIPWFSNPNVSFMGTPTGNLNRNNALSIANQTAFVSGWVVSRSQVWVDFDNIFGDWEGSFNDPFLFISDGLNLANQGAGPSEPTTLWFKPGVSGQTLTINEPVVLRVCGAPVYIGVQ